MYSNKKILEPEGFQEVIKNRTIAMLKGISDQIANTKTLDDLLAELQFLQQFSQDTKAVTESFLSKTQLIAQQKLLAKK